MSAPRHLWSDDWLAESAAAAEELARLRAQAGPPRPPEPPEPPESARPPKPAHPREPLRAQDAIPIAAPGQARVRRPGMPNWRAAWRRVVTAARRLDHLRTRPALLAFLVALTSAVAAYAAVSLLDGAGSNQVSASTAGASGWLGVELAPFTSSVTGFLGNAGVPGMAGVVVTGVDSGSPAAAAGLEPGDVLAEVNNQPVASPAEVESALAGLRAGDRVAIQFDRGALTYTTQVTLASRPAGTP